MKKVAIDPFTAFTVLSLVSMGVGYLADSITETKSIGEGADKIMANVKSFIGRHGHGDYKKLFDSFLNNIKLIKDNHAWIKRVANESPENIDSKEALEKMETLIKTVEFVTEEANLVSKAFQEMKGFEDYSTDILQGIGLDFGTKTDAQKAQAAMEQFKNYLIQDTPKLNEQYEQLLAAVEREKQKIKENPMRAKINPKDPHGLEQFADIA